MKRTAATPSLFLYLIITFLLFSVGCGNDLTRDKASDLISKNLPNPVTATIASGRSSFYENERDILNKMVNNGLVKVVNMQAGGFGLTECNIIITEDGRKARIKEIINEYGDKYMLIVLGQRKPLEITGIKKMPDKNAAEVDFTWKIDNLTKFGTIFKEIDLSKGAHRFIRDGNIYSEKGYFDGKAYFTLFDDGWRIMKIVIGNQEYTTK